MSAITKIFGAIISFFTGLLGGILGIFSKKKGEFYLEIDPSKDSAAASQAVESSGGAAVASPPQEKAPKAQKAPKKKKAPK